MFTNKYILAVRLDFGLVPLPQQEYSYDEPLNLPVQVCHVKQGHIQEFVQGWGLNFFSVMGGSAPVGTRKPLEIIIFTDPGVGG